MSALCILSRILRPTRYSRLLCRNLSEQIAKERYDSRANEEITKKRARLLYQSKKRGMLENGVILASFADKYLQNLDPQQLDEYDRLINLPTNDWDIFYWATNVKPTPPEFETPVMKKLRDHINSKVSKKTNSILDNRRPDDIVMPAVEPKHKSLDIDMSSVSLTNYREELYDNRVRRFGGGQTMQVMTNWRKKHIERRLKRILPKPISLRNLSDNKNVEIFTQNTENINVATKAASQANLIDSEPERLMKHHNFLQYLLGSEFTTDVHEYDDEAEAWAEMIWHRNYGVTDITLAPSHIKCIACQASLHCCDYGLPGYMPKELFTALGNESEPSEPKCQQCKFSETYGVSLSDEMTEESYIRMLMDLKEKPRSLLCLLIDLTDFPGGIWDNLVELVGTHHKIIVVGNKLDLIPYDGPRMIERVTESLKKNLSKLRPGNQNLRISDVTVLSARTGFGVEALVTRLLSSSIKPLDIYLLGCKNTGKFTLFNALLQSDLSAIRKGDLISRVSVSKDNQLKFPINLAEGWEIELKKRRLERVERNTRQRENSLINTTLIRQATRPHMPILIDRINYPKLTTTNAQPSALVNAAEINKLPIKFTQDHPLANVTNPNPLEASEEKFSEHCFFHLTSSVTHKDQLHNLLTVGEKLQVFAHETIIPRKFSLRPLQSIFIAGLARLDLLTSNSTVIVTIFASKFLPVHVIQTRKADQFYNTFLGSPYLGVPHGDDQQRLSDWPGLAAYQENIHLLGTKKFSEGLADIVLSSVGWALINISRDCECVFKAFTPEARGISLRQPPLIAYARNIEGKKIRDTPLFSNPHYNIKRTTA